MRKSQNRRSFVSNAAKGAAAAGILSLGACATENMMIPGNSFIHHVFFWLKQPVTREVKEKFENALKKLVTVETITAFHLGIPASTNRDVIDTSYSYSLLTIFRNKEDQDIYQTHPTHLEFIRNCEELWEKVIVYDSVQF